MRGPAILAVLGLLAAWPGMPTAAAEPAAAGDPPGGGTVPVRTGDHPGFGRVVLDLPPGVPTEVSRVGERLQIRLPPSLNLAFPTGRAPRNVLQLAMRPGVAELTLAAGATWRRALLGDKLVIDVFDPPTPPRPIPTAPKERAATPAAPSIARATPPGAPAPHLPGVTVPASVEPAVTMPAIKPAAPDGKPAPAPSTATAVPVPVEAVPLAEPGPVAIMARVGANAAVGELQLPFASQTGAAALRRDGVGVIVFDERRPIDLLAARNLPGFAQASVQLLQAATVLTVPLEPGARLVLARNAAGWAVSLAGPDARQTTTARPIRLDVEAGRLRFQADEPATTVALADPATGGTLLVGTQRGPGQAVVMARAMPGVAVLPTWQGVAIEPNSDAVVLRQIPTGFSVEADGDGRRLAVDADGDAAEAGLDAVARAGGLSRRFAFPAGSRQRLARQCQEAIAAAAAAPAQSRGRRRLDVARAMIALGLGPEAQSTLAVAVADDPHLLDDPDAIGLSAIAALLAERPEDSSGLADPRLDGTDDVTFWRAVRAATAHEASPEAAQGFAATGALLLSYPAPLREHLLPLATETMLLGGRAEAARDLLAREPGAAPLAFARALTAELLAPADEAAAGYDALARSGDRLDRVRASQRLIELRHRGGKLDAMQAAAATERLIMAWRGDQRELATRLRAAELFAEGRGWRASLALLRDTAQAWPAEATDIRGRLQAVFAAAVRSDRADPLSPLELVALADENVDLATDGAGGEALAARLAERLAALELPSRAAAVLERLANAAGPGKTRAAYGASLAQLRLDLGDPAGSLAAVASTASSGLAPALETQRLLVEARALAAAGRLREALARLSASDDPEAGALRAELAERAHDWPMAATAWLGYAEKVFPVSGPLDPAQAGIVTRLASAAAQAGAEPMLAELRQRFTARLPAGDPARLFAVLTQRPVGASSDLKRAAEETALARKIVQGRSAADNQSSALAGRPIAAR